MAGVPVVVVPFGGVPVRPVDKGAPVLTVADNGLGMPITITDKGAPFVVQGLEWTPDRLFSNGQDGYWPDGYAPPPFTPEALFGTTTNGYLAGGYAPDPFTT